MNAPKGLSIEEIKQRFANALKIPLQTKNINTRLNKAPAVEIPNLTRMEENKEQWKLNQLKNIYAQLNKSKTRGGRKSRKSRKTRKTRKH